MAMAIKYFFIVVVKAEPVGINGEQPVSTCELAVGQVHPRSQEQWNALGGTAQITESMLNLLAVSHWTGRQGTAFGRSTPS